MPAKRPKRARKPKSVDRWQQRVTRSDQSLELEPGVFTSDDPAEVARSLLRSAKKRERPFRAAMSVLVFHINRSGRNLTKSRRSVLKKAKAELRALRDG